jgi:hypothetical protein
MKRLLLLLLAYAVGGAIINVAVAWGLAAFAGPYSTAWIGRSFEAHKALPDFVRRSHATHPRNRDGSWDAESGYAFTGYDVYVLRSRGTAQDQAILETTSLVTGWPMRTVWSRYAYYTDSTTVANTGSPTLASGDPKNLGEEEEDTGILLGDVWMPYRIIWPGFAINTIFYAAILWLLFAAPGFVRRRFVIRGRVRRGQCPACAYPVGASNVCTECGAVLPLPQGKGRGEGEARVSKDAP